MMMDFLQSEWVQKLRKLFPAASFFGGFAWDSFTLGKLVQTSDLAILLLYYLASLILLILLLNLYAFYAIIGMIPTALASDRPSDMGGTITWMIKTKGVFGYAE